MIFVKDIKLWLPVWTGSKGQIGVSFLKIFFDNYRSVQWCKNCEFTSCGCWDMIFVKDIKPWLPVWTGSKGQIGVTFLSIFFDKQRSVQWCKNCDFTSCGCWDMIFVKDIKPWLPVWTGSKGQIGVTFLSIFFDKQRSVQWCKNYEFTSCGCWDMIFLNIMF